MLDVQTTKTLSPEPIGKTETPVDHRLFIETVAWRKIQGFRGTIDEKGDYYSRIYAGNSSLSDSIAADYHGRFLIELVQNGHDAHSREETGGEVEVVFDHRESSFGTLYVANRGAPFADKNVEALCEMGLSSKPPGEAIGNKGLGFRSVVHISDHPHVYSCASGTASAAGSFDGFCFRFANQADLEQLIDDARHLLLARIDLPLFHVPIWLDRAPPLIEDFARRGYASVIALPLRDADAVRAVTSEIERMRRQTVPILLFMTRLKRLVFRTLKAGAGVDNFVLTRQSTLIGPKDAGLTTVSLEGAGHYLIARASVAESAMMAAIADGIEQKQLHKHWTKWEGEGEVALAVRLDEQIDMPRLFTFLPMGEEAAAPLNGHLHGSFFPSSNRKGLDASVALNAILLNAAAALAARLVSDLARAEASAMAAFDPGVRACAAVDLLCWRKVASLSGKDGPDLARRVVEGVTEALGTAFAEAPIIPCLEAASAGATIGWCNARASRRWHTPLSSFSAETAATYRAATNIAPIWPGLGNRTESLVAFLHDQIDDFVPDPTPSEQAKLVVAVAEGLERTFTPLERWQAFYRDLARFMHGHATALAGKSILLTREGRLRPAMTMVLEGEGRGSARRSPSAETLVFSPPAHRGTNDEADQLAPPPELAASFAFLDDTLDWHDDLSNEREFLEKARLVYSFDRENMLVQLSRIVRFSNQSTLRIVGLNWAFQVWSQPRATGRPFKLQPQHRFYVPTIGNDFIEAGEAIFSDTWPETTQGRLLERFLSSAPGESDDLDELASRRLAPRSHYAFGSGTVELWTEFLTELGVKSGLQPVSKKVAPNVKGNRLISMEFCSAIGISAEAADLWKSDILAANVQATNLQSTGSYHVGELWWLPGQGDHHRFSRECREYYAQLIIAMLAHKLPALTVHVHHHHFIYADARDWPTPIVSFLRRAAWIPATESTAEGVQRLEVMPLAMWIGADSSDRFLSFLRRPSVPVMRSLERASPDQLQRLRDLARLRFLDQSDTLLEQADFLALQFAREGFDRYFERHLLNQYFPTWTAIAVGVADGSLDLRGKNLPETLIVRRRGRSEVVRMMGESVSRVYVRDSDDDTLVSLVEASGEAYFDARTHHARIGALFRRLYEDRVRLFSEVDYGIEVDNGELGVGDVISAVERCPRLRPMIAAALEALRGDHLQRLPADRQTIIARLERLPVQRATSVSFRIDKARVDDAIDGRRAFALKLGDGRPIVLVRAPNLGSWDIINESLDAICEAIGQPTLEPHLRLLVHVNAGDGALVDDNPPLDDELERYASALRLRPGARQAARDTLGARLDRHLPWFRALVHLIGGTGAVETFAAQELAAMGDIGEFRKIFTALVAPLELSVDAILEASRTALSVAEWRDALGLDFAAFNKALVAVGSSPDIYPDLHANCVANYVRENERAIIDALRFTHRRSLAEGIPAPAYAIARDAVRVLAPDPGWVLIYRDVPAPVVATHVEAWLRDQGVPPLEADAAGLPPLDAIRRANAAAVRAFAATASPLLRAWAHKRQRPVPPPWDEADSGVGSLRVALDQAGVFDVQVLDESALFAWVLVLRLWPTDLEATFNLRHLGLDPKDLEVEADKARAEADSRRKDARSVPFNGRSIDPEEVDWEELAKELAISLSSQMLSTPLNNRAELLPAKVKEARDPDEPRRGRQASPPQPRAPSQKTDMIGRLGELAVRVWLRRRLPRQDIDAAWVSRNAEPFTGRIGSDSLGYDFETTVAGRRWLIEVKASLGDPCMFEMGETEVRAGRAAARRRGGPLYLIAYVSNLAMPSAARIELLPNPMSEDGEAVLNLLGQGLRYSFGRRG